MHWLWERPRRHTVLKHRSWRRIAGSIDSNVYVLWGRHVKESRVCMWNNDQLSGYRAHSHWSKSVTHPWRQRDSSIMAETLAIWSLLLDHSSWTWQVDSRENKPKLHSQRWLKRETVCLWRKLESELNVVAATRIDDIVNIAYPHIWNQRQGHRVYVKNLSWRCYTRCIIHCLWWRTASRWFPFMGDVDQCRGVGLALLARNRLTASLTHCDLLRLPSSMLRSNKETG